MSIHVAKEPNELGTYRYDVRVGSRTTHGFRTQQTDARRAAQEDSELLYLCHNIERVASEAEGRDE